MKIEWTEPAIADLQDIYDYISVDARKTAQRFVDKLFKSTEKLKNFPFIGRKVPEDGRENIREILIQEYRIVYRVEDDRIRILAVIHGRRDVSFVIKVLESKS